MLGFLNRKRPGYVVFVALIAMLPVSGVFLASMNAGQMTDDRATAQDGADALARMHATWSARSVNVIAMNQVAMTQLVSVQIGSEALDGTLTELSGYAWESLGFIGLHSVSQCPRFKWWPIVAACFGQHAYEGRHPARALSAVSRTRRAFDPVHGIKTSHRGLDALEAMNKAIVAQFPKRIAELAEDYLTDLDVDDVHFTDPCAGDGVTNCTQTNTRDGMALPIKRSAVARADACFAMELGTDVSRTAFHARGFPRLKGPMSVGGSQKHPRLKPHIEDITKIWKYLEDFKKAHKKMELMRLGRWTKFPQYLNLIGSQGRSSNSFTRRFDAKYASACVLGSALPTGLVDLTLRRPMPEFWETVSGSRLDVTAQTMPPEFKVLDYAFKQPNQRVGRQVFESPSRGQFAYGQASVYNPEGSNTFSQSWTTLLVPADKLDDPQSAARKLREGGRAPFRPLSDNMNAATGAGWDRIHAH